jgi:hypothetical protein
MLERLVGVIVLVKESHGCSMFRVSSVQDFQLKHHLKARYDLSPQLLKLTLIYLILRPTVAFLRVSKHDLRLLIELIHLPLLYDLDSLP